MRHAETIERRPREGKAGEGASPGGWTISPALALLILGAALFRAVLFHLASTRSVFFDGLILDSRVYDAWASALARGDWIGREAFYFPPLYPYLLGGLYKVVGRSLPAVYLLQSLLGLVNIVLIHRIGARLFSERAGFLAALAAALYAPFPFFEMKLLGTTLGLTLNLAALASIVAAEIALAAGRRATGRWLASGLIIGTAAACLPGIVLLALLYTAALAWRRRAVPAAALLAGAVAATLPVLAHNLAVASDPLPLSGQGGLTFYQGNNPNARGMYSAPPGFSGSPETQAAEETSVAERETGRSMRRSQSSAHFLRKGLQYIVTSPAAWLALEGRKILRLAGDYEGSTEYSLYYERERIPWLRLAFLPFAVVAGAGVAGLALAGRPRPPVLALFLYTLYAAAVPLVFYVSSRYRLPLVPALILYGAFFADRALSEWRASRTLASPTARAVVAALLIALISFFPLGSPVASAEANVQYSIGNVLAEARRHDEAIAAFDRAVAEWPPHAFAWINRGNSLDKLGREDEALASYRRAAQANPTLWAAWKAQGIILHRQKRYDEEEAVYRSGLRTGGEEAWYLLGVALKNLDRIDEAVAALREAVRINPSYARAHTRLGEIFAARGEVDPAREEFRKALASDPGDTAARNGLNRLGG